ncbi:MAG: TatD family hydrolase, partial [Dehalococcoidia bacterium]|nr:TatD family hydrolase [Dehalococcoidia bacterium]
MIQIVDTHAHLESLENIEKVLGEARLKGVAAIVAMGSDYQSDVKTLELAAKFKGYVFPAVGLHPWELGRSQAGELERVLKLIEENNEDIVAIGEIGLDYHKSVKAEASKDRQQAVLKELLLLSRKLGKPVSLHSRYAWKDCLSCVREAAVDKAVFHWFTGFSSVLQGIISAGYYISVTPAAEYHAEPRRAIKEA